MPYRRHGWVVTAVLLGLATPQAEAARLTGRIVRVGYPTSGLDRIERGADHYRPGCWTPVLVELDNREGDLFDGELQVLQLDRDGDQVVASVPVSVRTTRSYHLYVPGGRTGTQESFEVRVFQSDGTPAELYDSDNNRVSRLLPPRPLAPLPADVRVILDISERPINLADLTSDQLELTRPLVVSRISSAAVPDNVAGLEMVDTIIWDGADPSTLDISQRDALVHWTRRGGMLVLGVGRNWELVSRSRFAEMLPARLSGAETAIEFPELSESLFGGADAALNTPLTYCPIRPADLASDARAIMPAHYDANSRLFVTRRPWFRGEVVLVAAELRELLSHVPQKSIALEFVGDLLLVRSSPGPVDPTVSFAMPFDVFRYPEQLTGFRLISGVYFLLAFLFAVAYIGLGTGGTWLLLKNRNLTSYAWPVFAAVALAASAASLAAVQMVRGIGHQVQQLIIVDGRAGTSEAHARAYFGLKTGTHTLLDLQVPSDWLMSDESQDIPAGLRPLPPNPEELSPGAYSVPQRYEAIASAGQLRAVPFRATLKQFEAVWDGRLQGSLSASLVRERDTLRLRPESWIENNLPVDLEDCFLIVTRTNVSFHRPHRHLTTMAYPLGTLPAGRRIPWRQLQEQRPALRVTTPATDDPLDAATDHGRFLRDWHEHWLGRRGLDRLGLAVNPWQRATMTEAPLQEGGLQSALLLLTTYEEIDPRLADQADICRTRGWELDRSSCLNEQTALLVGFALNDPGPLRLCWRSAGTAGRWRPIQPVESRVMYRFTVPVR